MGGASLSNSQSMTMMVDASLNRHQVHQSNSVSTVDALNHGLSQPAIMTQSVKKGNAIETKVNE